MKIIAILGNIAGFCITVWLLGSVPSNPHWDEVTTVAAFAILFPVNVYFLVTGQNKEGNSRIRRMVGYWLDAKESELKAKAGKNT